MNQHISSEKNEINGEWETEKQKNQQPNPKKEQLQLDIYEFCCAHQNLMPWKRPIKWTNTVLQCSTVCRYSFSWLFSMVRPPVWIAIHWALLSDEHFGAHNFPCAIFQCSSPIKFIWKFIVVILWMSCVRGMCVCTFVDIIFYSLFLSRTMKDEMKISCSSQCPCNFSIMP